MTQISGVGDAALMQPVLARMRSVAPCSAELEAQVAGLGGRVETIAAKTVLYQEESPSCRPRFLLDGWACRYQDLYDGRRQIFDVLLPGDSLGLCLYPSPFTSPNMLALTPLRLADASSFVKDDRTGDSQTVFRAQAQAEQKRALRHMLRLGRMTALERLADIFLELHERLEAVGKTEGARFAFPLTQEVLADLTGLSVVHVNRTLQEVRRRRLIVIERGKVCILDVKTLAEVASRSYASVA